MGSWLLCCVTVDAGSWGGAAHLVISHLILQGLELALMLAPHLGFLHAQLTAQLLLLLPLPLTQSRILLTLSSICLSRRNSCVNFPRSNSQRKQQKTKANMRSPCSGPCPAIQQVVKNDVKAMSVVTVPKCLMSRVLIGSGSNAACPESGLDAGLLLETELPQKMYGLVAGGMVFKSLHSAMTLFGLLNGVMTVGGLLHHVMPGTVSDLSEAVQCILITPLLNFALCLELLQPQLAVRHHSQALGLHLALIPATI